MNIADRLFKYRIFGSVNRSLKELSVLEAIRRYKEALITAEALSCYSLLFSALEKAINADLKRKDKEFDRAASATSGLSEPEIGGLRKFANRIKHALHNHSDLETLRAGESNLASLSISLKKAADSAILLRV